MWVVVELREEEGHVGGYRGVFADDLRGRAQEGDVTCAEPARFARPVRDPQRLFCGGARGRIQLISREFRGFRRFRAIEGLRDIA